MYGSVGALGGQPPRATWPPTGPTRDRPEEARFLDDLLTIHGMSVAEVAQTLSRSKGWISMRRSLLDEISPAIQKLLFRGAFPVYSYMYTLRPFMRMNSVTQEQIERFVETVAGMRLSVRDIELLAHAYFRGTPSLREAIEAGKLGWSLDQLKSVPEDREGCNGADWADWGQGQIGVRASVVSLYCVER